jgi:hypothetical protein
MDASLGSLSFAAFLAAQLLAVIVMPQINFSDDQPSADASGILPHSGRDLEAAGRPDDCGRHVAESYGKRS